MQVNLNQGLLLEVMIVIGLLLGLRRGATRELVVLLGVLLGILIAPIVAPKLLPAFSMARNSVSGLLNRGTSGASAASVTSSQTMDLIVFGVLYVLAVLVAQVLIKPPKDFGSRLLGSLIGAVTWYAIARFAFPRLFQSQETVLVISGNQAQAVAFTPTNTAVAIVVFIMVLIGIGIRQTAPKKKRSS